MNTQYLFSIFILFKDEAILKFKQLKKMRKKKSNSDKQILPQRYYLTKDRQGNYQIINELAYEKKLIYG